MSSVNEKIVTSVILYLEVASVSIPNLVRIFMEKHPDIQLTIMQHHLPDDITDPVLVHHFGDEAWHDQYSYHERTCLCRHS